MQTAVMLITIAAIISVIYIGNKRNINLGLLAIPAALVIDVFILGNASANILAKWPTTVALNIVGIMFFYTFVMDHGIMKYVAGNATYAIRKIPALFPIFVFAITVFLSMTGIFPTMISPLLLPTFLGIADKMKVNKLAVVLWMVAGSVSGSMMPSSASVTWVQGFISMYAPDMSAEILAQTMNDIITLMFLGGLIVFVVLYIIFRGWTCGKSGVDDDAFQKPDPLDAQQKKCFTVFVITMILVIIPKTLAFLGVTSLAGIANKLDITLVFISAGVICALLGLGNAAEIVKNRLPWNVPVMIFGMSVLFDIVNRCGLSDILCNALSGAIPGVILVALILVISAVLTLISDGMAVVIPLTFPVAWSICQATGLSTGVMFTAAYLGLSVAGIFPFSTSGAMIMSLMPQEEQDGWFKRLAIGAVINIALYAIVMAVMSFVF